jgi:hypothetical protein
LHECPRCQAYFEATKKLEAVLSDTLSSLEPARELASVVAAEVERSQQSIEPAPSDSGRRWQAVLWRGALGLAAGVLVALLVHIWQKKPASPATVPEVVAEVSSVSGKAELKRPDSSGWQRLQPGEQVLSNHLVRTGAVGSLELDFKAGGKLCMHAGSLLAIHSARELALEDGELWLELSTEGDPFSIVFGQTRATLSRGKIKLSVERVQEAALPRLARAAAKRGSTDRASARAARSAIGWLDES